MTCSTTVSLFSRSVTGFSGSTLGSTHTHRNHKKSRSLRAVAQALVGFCSYVTDTLKHQAVGWSEDPRVCRIFQDGPNALW